MPKVLHRTYSVLRAHMWHNSVALTHSSLALNKDILDDLKAVTERLIVEARLAGSKDNISIIVVFLKDPREIAAQNRPPMDLGLDNAVVNAPPFAVEGACDAAEAAGADNGVSDSDSEDLGPETAVDVDADADDADVEMRSHEPPLHAPRAPPARIVEEGHVDGNLVDNVAESGEESEDEWNYYKGEGEREQNPSEEADEPPRSETPCQDNSAWESSSVDMNSSPLNPDAPPFVPGSVAGSDVLLAESPRKPLPMDDIEVPDVNQFQTGAGSCPGELQDLDNCDQLNGHHNISMEGVTEHLNGNDKCQLDSLGFGFNVGIETDKEKESRIIQDFERIQKDTTDFCNIQVFQTHTETNPFGNETNDELFERLKNKERDPMSMSFYQEKDDDTCERFSKLESHVDLNAVQPLPESDDEDDIQANGFCQNIQEGDDDKENLSPDQHADTFAQISNDQEPNNDIMRFDDGVQVIENNFVDNMIDCNVESNNMQHYCNNEFEGNLHQENVMPTDTPESHKLLFEQIPEIPDGKSSELGFTNEDLLDPSESEKDVRAITPQDEVSQDVEIDDKLEESPCDEIEIDMPLDSKDDVESTFIEHTDVADKDNEIVAEVAIDNQISENLSVSPELLEKNNEIENSVETEQNVVVDIHQSSESQLNHFENDTEEISNVNEVDHITKEEEAVHSAPKITLESDEVAIHDISSSKSPEPEHQQITSQSPLPNEFAEQNAESPLPQESLQGEASLPRDSPLPDDLCSAKSPLPSGIVSDVLESSESPLPSQSPLPTEPTIEVHSPVPSEEQSKTPLPAEIPLPRESPAPSESPAPVAHSPLPVEEPVLGESPLPVDEPVLGESPLPVEEPVVRASPQPVQESVPTESLSLGEESIPTRESPFPVEQSIRQSPSPAVSPFPVESQVESSIPTEKLPAESPVPDTQNESQENLLTNDRISSPVEERQADAVENISQSFVTEDLMRKESPAPVESVASPAPEECQSNEISVAVGQDSKSPLPSDTFKSAISPAPSPAPEIAAARSPLPTEDIVAITQSDSRATPEVEQIESNEMPREENAPAPDIVPEQARSDLVTDIDIGIPESRAQEICVPVTSEIQQEDAVRPAGTPPPTPAVEGELDAAPLSDAPIAAPAALAGAAVAAAAVTAATVATTKAKAPAKKSPTTPTPRASNAAPKTTAARTSLAATTPRSPATASPRLAAAKTPSSASKAAAPAVRAKPAPKPASPTKAAPKAAAPAKDAAAKPTAARPTTARPAPARPATAKPTPKPAAPKPPTTTAAPKPITRPTAPRAPSATAPAAPKPAAARPATAKTSSTLAAAPKPKEVKKVPEKKPLTNGDVKAAKPAPRPAPAAPRAAPPPRAPAPRPAARAPAAPPTKTASAKPPVKAPLDKQSKDLANKRITAKTAPPRTANTKSAVGNKTAVKSVPKRSEREQAQKAQALANGALGPKAPPSPPADTLLPDVIA
ncbi:unnamed protein product [Colias eurytheme]|nr:unnamed protein product [Colias eurytheme]